MRLSTTIRTGLIASLVVGGIPLAVAHAQAPAAKAKTAAPPAAPGTAKSAAPAPAPVPAPAPATAAPSPRPLANPAQVVATVNGETITKGDLFSFLSRYETPPLPPEQIYQDAVETLINTRLIGQFLERQRIAAAPEKVNEAIAQLQRELQAEGRDLKTALQEAGQTVEELRKEYEDRIRWVEYLKLKGTDAELKKFATTHKDLINGTQVKASHIFLEVPPTATAADKEKIRQKLLGIKQDIEAKKISFAEAANKYSEDPANSESSGGDIGYFGLNTGVVEEFANAAFALKPGQVSDPVETSHGYHLILVTDRKEGSPVDFEQQKPYILQMYAAELQKQILSAERKAAKIDIKPMPADLFPPAPPAATTPAPAPAPSGTNPTAPAPKPAPGTPK